MSQADFRAFAAAGFLSVLLEVALFLAVLFFVVLLSLAFLSADFLSVVL